MEDRLKFYETGDLPRKNVEVMGEAFEEVAEDAKKKKKMEKKKQNAKSKQKAKPGLCINLIPLMVTAVIT